MSDYTLGYYNYPAGGGGGVTGDWQHNRDPFIIQNLPSHFGIRLRFSIYLHNWDEYYYTYYLQYSIDSSTRVYNPSL